LEADLAAAPLSIILRVLVLLSRLKMMLKSAAAKSASKAFAAKGRAAIAVRPVVCRAEEKSIAKSDRTVGGLYKNTTDDAALAYLDGSLPGDYGFDPLGLLDPVNSGGFVNPQWLAYSEVIHGRWAMLGAAGCIAPEILAAAGATPAETGVVWFRSGVIPPAGSYDGYWTDPYTLFFIEVVAMQFAELRRWQDFKAPGSNKEQYFLGLERVFGGSGNPAYPGGQFFNMFNLGKTEAEMKKLKTNEIKNGRLAMLAMFGYGAQAVMTGNGPFQNLVDHLASPTTNNILGNFAIVEGPL